MKLKTFIPVLAIALMQFKSAKADQGFIVENIQVNGLQRITAGTVYNYLPVHIGERFEFKNTKAAIRALFQTGFFKDIIIGFEGTTLVVEVVERPSVAKIVFEGNKDIGEDDLKEALKKIGLAEGKVFNQQALEKVQQELKRQYFSHGKYGLKIETKVTPLTRNRVGIKIQISEGRVAKIKQINIVGNHAFDDDKLLGEFELGTTNLLSFYTKNDQYSKQKLSADVERLRSYYMDRGYANFTIESTQVAITPDKKGMYVTINIKEGDVFTLEKVKLSGNLVVEPDKILKLVEVGPGETFSLKKATETSKAISDRLGDEGYIFANVNMLPEINNETKTVVMTFFVDPSQRVYVRRINMTGNTKTRDEVLRREMRQMESSWASSTDIERSKTRLERLGYFESVNVETPPVVGTSDQVDVNYTVVEKSSGNITAGVGFSQVQGIVLNANISQDNVFGSGKRVNLAFNNSNVTTDYRFGFLNPYFTQDGVSLGYDLGYRTRDADAANIANYSTNVMNAGLNFGIPINEYDRLSFNADLKNTDLTVSNTASTQIQNFVNQEGKKFLTLSFSVGWSHDTLNRAIFPTEGGQQRLYALATVPGSDLEYYKFSYKHQRYFPIAKDLTLKLYGEFAYGDSYGQTDTYPFFEHYYAGGVRSIRGFNDNTIGPRDSRGAPFGGNSKIIGHLELFFPVPFLEENRSMRLGTFLDAGNVTDGLGLDNFKASVGISGEWMSPFGAIAVSIAAPLNANGDDDTKSFQFSFGSGF